VQNLDDDLRTELEKFRRRRLREIQQESDPRGLRGPSHGEGEEDVTALSTTRWRGIDRGPRLLTNCN
jgi:hypothetical protein